MKNRTALFLLSALMMTAPLAAADRAWTSDEVIHQARKRAKIVVQGHIERAINFDYFIFADDTGKLLLNAASVKQRMAAGDKVAVYGRVLGHATRFDQTLTEIEALEVGTDGSDDAKRILSTRLASTESVPAAAVPAPSPITAATPLPEMPGAENSIESRLKFLEELKKKSLITDDEYREQRKRILGDL